MSGRRGLSLLLALCMVLAWFPMQRTMAAETVDSGSCGENLTWVLDTDRTLTISGEGEMEDYDDPLFEEEGDVNLAPWNEYSYGVRKIVVEPGVTSIGDYAFYFFSHTTVCELPDTLVTIGRAAFWGMANAYFFPEDFDPEEAEPYVSVVIPEGVTTIERGAFSRSYIKSFSLPSTLKTVGESGLSSYYVEAVHVPDMESWMGIQFDSFYATPFSMVSGALLYVDGEPVTDVVIPYGITEIKDSQFMSYTAMTSIQIPDTVTRVGDYAFYNNINGYNGGAQLREIVFPASVAYIGADALHKHESLERIVILNPDCEINPYMFCADPWGVSEAPPPVVYGFAGSTAEAYAAEYGLEFVALETYQVLEGADSTVRPNESLTIRVDGPFSEFQRVAVDGLTVSPDDYTVTEGSTVLTFSADYLSTLEERAHSVTVFFAGGIATATITVSGVLPGDCNGDGKVSTLDAITLRQHLADWEVSVDAAAADCNGDGRVNGLDAIVLRQYLAGWDVTLGA